MNRNRIMAWLLLATVAGYWFVQAGSLEPSSQPAPTMSSLELIEAEVGGIPSAWFKVIDDPLRFGIVMNGQAVIDTETGLVWDRTPDELERNWYDSINHCFDRVVDNRKGWRLPVAEELFSLIDPSESMPALPPNHPFTTSAGGAGGNPRYWTMTAYADGFDPTPVALTVAMDNGSRSPQVKTISYFAWCVRGGSGYDAGQG